MSRSQPQRPNVPGSQQPSPVELQPLPADPALLEAVLQRTLAAAGPEELDLAHQPALAAVARRYQGQPLAIDPMVAELVTVILRPQFPIDDRPGFWQDMVRRVAETLWDDPASRSRLETLWDRLGGGVL